MKKFEGKTVATVRGINTVWVPSFTCEDDVEMNTCMQDLADRVLIDRESALTYLDFLKETYKEEWSDYVDVSPTAVFDDIPEDNLLWDWYGWEFTWTSEGKKYACAMYVQETPIMGIKRG